MLNIKKLINSPVKFHLLNGDEVVDTTTNESGDLLYVVRTKQSIQTVKSTEVQAREISTKINKVTTIK